MVIERGEAAVRKYVLDTNIYIDAIRDPQEEEAFGMFLERNTPMTYMSAVVMQELRAGAVTDTQARALQDGIFGAFERRNCIAGPSPGAFKGGNLCEVATSCRRSCERYGWPDE